MRISFQANSIVKELHENPRLRTGVWIILAIGLVYGGLVFSDRVKTMEAAYVENTQKILKLEQILSQTAWPERASEARTLAVQIESLLWKASSKGLAQASVQNWINRQLKKCSLSDARTRVEETAEIKGYPGIWQVSANIETLFSRDAFFKLLQIIEKDKAIVIEQLDIRHRKQKKIDLSMKVYFQANTL